MYHTSVLTGKARVKLAHGGLRGFFLRTLRRRANCGRGSIPSMSPLNELDWYSTTHSANSAATSAVA
jgi:hypothetical protein